jgi:hypothetical protein
MIAHANVSKTEYSYYCWIMTLCYVNKTTFEELEICNRKVGLTTSARALCIVTISSAKSYE